MNFYFPTFGNTDALKDSYRLNSHDSRILKFGHFSFTSNNIRVYLEIEIRERNLENFCSGCFQINGYAPFLISTTYLITLGLSNLSLRFISRHSRQDYPIEKFRIITIPSFISFDKYSLNIQTYLGGQNIYIYIYFLNRTVIAISKHFVAFACFVYPLNSLKIEDN